MNTSLPRVLLGSYPTPIEPLPRLSKLLQGPSLYVKRDDLTGLAGGGNKVRKLEFLVADALAQNADTLVTLGAAQSNHCRQTAGAAARCGLRSILVLRGKRGRPDSGNLLLDHLLGAEVRWSGRRSRETVVAETVAQERAAGRNPYPIPIGGSNALGGAAYSLAMEEVLAQMASNKSLSGVRFDRIIVASSSGGTHAGLVVGATVTGYDGEVLGIAIDEKLKSLQKIVARIASETAARLGVERKYRPDDIRANDDYLGAGYGVLGSAEREAIELFARQEGILLDPVYTGRAAAGMIDLIRRGVIGRNETILFWHTGGVPALWAYGKQLLSLA